MAVVKIDIPGIGEVTAQNAASERTLLEILKTLNVGNSAFDRKANSGGGGGSSNPASKAQELLTKNTKKSYTGLGILANIAGKVLGGAFNLLASTVMASVGSFLNLGKELLVGGNRLTDFAQHLPIPFLSTFTQLLDNQIDQFRELSQAGAGFGNSIIDISRVAAQAAMPQAEFLSMVRENSEELKRFGSTTQNGARLFADMSKRMRQSQMGINLMNLGFTAGELNENMIAFSEITQMAGTRQNLTTNQLIQGSMQYSDTLDSLSRMTGKHRDLIAQQVKDMMSDADMQRAVQMYGEEFAASLASLPAGTDALQQSILDMVDGIPHDDVTKGFLQVSKTFQDGADKFGEMSLEDKNAFLAKVSAETTAYVDTLSVEQQQSLKRSNTIMAGVVEASAGLRKVTEADLESIKKEKARQDEMTKKLTGFEQTIQNIRDKIKLALIDSGIFEKITDAISKFVPSAEEANTMFDTATKYFNENILPSLKSIYDWFTVEGETGTTGIKSFLDWFELTALPAAKKAFKYLTNLSTEDGRKQLKQDIVDGVKSMASGLMDSVIAWMTDPETIVKTLTNALLLLSPGGLMMTAVKLIIAGIVNLISWDDIKAGWDAWEPTSEIGQGIKNMVTKAVEWIGDTFSWTAIKKKIGGFLPDNKLGNWAREKLGIGNDTDEVALADTKDNKKTTTAENPKAEEVAKAEETVAKTEAEKQKLANLDKSTSDSDNQLAMLNTSMQQLIDLTKKNTTAVKALNGNIMAG
jgi:hypothetical protein